MKIFLVAAVLCLTILAQAWGAPGQHYLIETEDGEDDNDGGGDYYCEDCGEEAGGNYNLPLPLLAWRGWGQAASNSHASNKNNIMIG